MDQHGQQDPNHRLGRGMIFLGWAAALGLLTFLFSQYLDHARNPNQDVAYRVGEGGVREVDLDRNRQGHYVADGSINGQQVEFFLDTGATQVSVPGQVAKRLGLKPGLPYTVSTANGTVTVYATRLQRLQLGAIELHDVRADINPHMDGEEVLLGMSVLGRLEMVQRDGHLILRQYAGQR
jgi:aspartyl protease family protein